MTWKVTAHAMSRFVERFKRDLTNRQANELIQAALRESMKMTLEQIVWGGHRPKRGTTCRYHGESGMVFVITKNRVVVTCFKYAPGANLALAGKAGSA